MSLFHEWAAQWGVPAQALADLAQRLAPPHHTAQRDAMSEGGVQDRARLNAATKGIRAFRNNVGALVDSRGVPVRYGLANDSKAVNDVCKSADLIGIAPRLITGADVGQTLGQFWSRECKAVGGRTDTKRLAAQERWRDLILAAGGDAKIIDDPADV